MKKRVGVVHALFACQDCEATFEKHKNAQALAARHAKHYNHYVTGEVGVAVWYNEDHSESGGKEVAPIHASECR